MKKMLKGLLVAAFAVSTMNATTNKTFLMPRSQGVNLPMEYTTYNELIQYKNGDFFGAHFQVVPYYMDSSDKSDIGEYFGTHDRSSVRLGNSTAVTNGTADVNYRYIIHDGALSAGTATLKFRPELEAYGLRIDYYQDLEKILDGLYLKVALPISHVKTEMNMGVSNLHSPLNTNTPSNIHEYFEGDYTVATGNTNAQSALNKAKRTGVHSETSVADIDVVLGYKFLDKDKYYVGLNLGLTIPVGNDADGIHTFEPIVGNGDHWAFGGGLDTMVKLWEDGDQNIKLTLVANYRYLFEASEKRTLGLKDTNGNQVRWGQYYLVGVIDTNRSAQQLFPAANITTQNVDVTPGSQLDAIIYFTYNNGGWTFDLGYNFFWKEGEDVSIKHHFTENYYGIANIAADMQYAKAFTTAGDGSTDAVGGALAYLNNDHSSTSYGLDKSVAETSASDTNKIFGGIGYNFKDWEYPLMLGIGGAYEFADDNGIENWQIWGKVGIKF